jgi:hypothetical protein
MRLKKALLRLIVALWFLMMMGALRLAIVPGNLLFSVPITLAVHGSEELKKWMRRVRSRARVIPCGYGNSVVGAWSV